MKHLKVGNTKGFDDGLNSKVKLKLYKTFCRKIEFENYLQGIGDPGTRLMFKFRSGTNGLNDELGRHRAKSDDRHCKLCGDECERVVHVFWECPAYDSIRNTFVGDLEKLLGKNFVEFSALDDFSKAGFILESENWDRYDFEALLKLVRSFVLSIWDARKDNLYGDNSDAISDCSSSCPTCTTSFDLCHTSMFMQLSIHLKNCSVEVLAAVQRAPCILCSAQI